MDEARSSWNTLYQSKEGFDCQITLRDEDEARLAERAGRVMTSIARSGGIPLKRKGYVPGDNAGDGDQKKERREPNNPEKTYVDENGVRRCNRKLNDGTMCGAPVTKREGRYGPFWSCPNYREHAR